MTMLDKMRGSRMNANVMSFNVFISTREKKEQREQALTLARRKGSGSRDWADIRAARMPM